MFVDSGNGAEIITGFKARNIDTTPKINAITRMIGLEIVDVTTTLKILNPPPSREINIKTAPKAKKPIVRFSGILPLVVSRCLL